MMPFVLDNSVVSGWYLENQASAYTDSIAERLQADRAWVPSVWELELVNVLRNACIRQRMTAEAAHRVVAHVMSLPIEVERQPGPPSEILGLSLRFGLTAYDASYLALALRLQIGVATVDEALRAAARAAGVGVVG
ncbi:MAG: type II toxin-antitoxin system VapC family toxin [Burkholderiales bacterium]|nr:MAG: type II toxin-antitoxin system VapC family toxin [Burkholderiales bacterium]